MTASLHPRGPRRAGALRRCAWLLLAWLFASLAGTRDARAFCRSTTIRPRPGMLCSTAGIPVMWCAACVGMSLNPAGTPDVPIDELRAVAAASMARWRDVACPGPAMDPPAFELQLIDDSNEQTGFNDNGPNAHVIWFNQVWAIDEDHRPATIAITRSRRDPRTGAILGADIEFNQRSEQNPDGFRFTTGPANTALVDLPTVLTHEMGHFLGLGHSDLDRAVMWESAGLGEQRRALAADDVEGVCDIYAFDRRPSLQCDPLGTTTRPALQCNPTPYGGFSPGPSAARVRGGCSVGRPSATHRAQHGLYVAWVLVALAHARRVRRAANAR